jgi:hypothetical protein
LAARVSTTRAPFSLFVCIESFEWRTQASPSGSEQEIPACHDRLSRQPGLEQYPIDPKNPLHPDQTSVSVARRCERQEEQSGLLSYSASVRETTNGRVVSRCAKSKRNRCGQSKREGVAAQATLSSLHASYFVVLSAVRPRCSSNG